jgi:hypothetical protein
MCLPEQSGRQPPFILGPTGVEAVNNAGNDSGVHSRNDTREKTMSTSIHEPDAVPQGRVAREVARERRERALHDELRAGLAPLDDRIKDARERFDTCNLKRHHGR